MSNIPVVGACFVALACMLPAQQVPVLKVKSPILDVQDGDRLLRGGWRVDPSRNGPADELCGGVVCMEVLQRGHWLLDYPGRRVLWQANALAATPIPVRLAWPSWLLVGGGAVLLGIAVLATSAMLRGRRHGR